MKKLGALRGLAILLVVVGHAAGYGMMVLAWWGHRFGKADAIPDWSWVGTSDYYGLVGVNLLSLCSVPLFLFASGFYVNYAARTSSTHLSYRMVRGWIKGLFHPCLVWMLVSLALALPTLMASAFAAEEWVALARRRTADYYYVILLGQLFLLCPLLVRLSISHPVLLLVSAALLQVTYSGVHYLKYVAGSVPDVVSRLDFWGSPLPWHWGFFFVLGLLTARYREQIREHLAKLRWSLAVAAVLFALLSVVETDLLNRLDRGFVGVDDWKLSSTLYATALVLGLFAFEWDGRGLRHALGALGTQSYGIYLVQPIAIEHAARFAYHATPQLLPQPLLFVPFLVTVGLAVPLSIMAVVARSPARKHHRRIFGS